MTNLLNLDEQAFLSLENTNGWNKWENTGRRSVLQLPSEELSTLVSSLTLLIGIKGTGKTTLLKRLLTAPELLPKHQLLRAILWDITGRVSSELGTAVYTAENWREIESAFKNGCFPLCVQADFDDFVLLDYLCNYVWSAGNTLICFDEADTVFSVRDTFYLPASLKHLLARSRHRNLAVCAAVRRPSEVPPTVRAFAETWVLFRMHYPPDLKALEQSIQMPLEKLRTLGRGEFLTF